MGLICLLLPFIAVVVPFGSSTEQVAGRHTEGLVHGFLVLRTQDGETLAHGDLTQSAPENSVTSRVVFRSRDGSRNDETTIYSERRS